MNHSLPLTNRTILVTRSAGQSSQFTRFLQQYGATVLELPTIEIGPPSSWQPLDQAIAELASFDWLVLTSSNGVDFFCARLAEHGRSLADFHGLKLAVVGQKTALALRDRGIEPDFIPPDFVADSLVAAFPESDRLSTLKLLFPRVETGGRDVLVKSFTERGATVVEVPAYESDCATTMPEPIRQAFQQQTIDIITFASSKTVHCFRQLLISVFHLLEINSPPPKVSDDNEGDDENDRWHFYLDSVALASIGPQTSIACQNLLGRVDIEAAEYTLEGLTQAIVEWFIHQAPKPDPQRSID